MPGGGHEDDILATGAAVEILAQHQVGAPGRRTVRLQVVTPARTIMELKIVAAARKQKIRPHKFA